jgi:hypothetical protein
MFAHLRFRAWLKRARSARISEALRVLEFRTLAVAHLRFGGRGGVFFIVNPLSGKRLKLRDALVS